MPVTSTPPPARKTPAAAKPAVEPQLTKDRRETLTGFGMMAQVPLIGFRLFADAATVGVHVPRIAKELAVLAETQEQVAAFIDPLIKVGPYTGLVTAVLPFLLQVGVNHGRVPAGTIGTVPATTLAAQMEMALAQAELEALQAQHDAERAAEEMREAMAQQRRITQDKLATAKVTVD